MSDIFKRLDRWRHLPKYQLEPRLTPYFDLFLLRILQSQIKDTDLHGTIIPELPIRNGTIFTKDSIACKNYESAPREGSNSSKNIDYVAYSRDLTTVLFVELKTDIGSRNTDQDKFLKCVRDHNFGELVKDVQTLARASDKKRKYVHLLHQLAELELLAPNDATSMLYRKFLNPNRSPSWDDVLSKLTFDVDGRLKKKMVVYIQPNE